MHQTTQLYAVRETWAGSFDSIVEIADNLWDMQGWPWPVLRNREANFSFREGLQV